MQTPLNELGFLPPIEPRPIFLRAAEPPPIIAPMTIGVAAICENGDAIVMAADRQLSYDHRTAGMVHDSQHPKLNRISDHAYVAITGGIIETDRAEEMLAESVNLPDLTTVTQIAKGLKRCCHQITAEGLDGIARRLSGLSLKEFYKRCRRGTANQIVMEIYNAIKQQDISVRFLLAGIDSAARIYIVDEYRVSPNHNPGFAAVGSGSTHAMICLSSLAQSPSSSLAETMYCVYAAKRSAEHASGVGFTTNMAVIRRDQSSEFLADEQIEPLREIYDKRSKLSLSEGELSSIRSLIPDGKPLEKLRLRRRSNRRK